MLLDKLNMPCDLDKYQSRRRWVLKDNNNNISWLPVREKVRKDILSFSRGGILYKMIKLSMKIVIK